MCYRFWYDQLTLGNPDNFRIQFTAPRVVRDKLRQAQDLLRHRIPSGELAAVIETAVDVLIDKLKKERFAVGRRPRKHFAPAPSVFGSGHIPDAIKRAVHERAEGRCEFVDESGRRCTETGGLEFDHLEGFARTRIHSLESIRLACRAHNQHAAEQLYGRAYMAQVRGSSWRRGRPLQRRPHQRRSQSALAPGAPGRVLRARSSD